MNFKTVIPCILMICLTLSSSAQKDYSINVIPPSPTVSSLAKYGELPVGYYTGIPQITIPLHKIDQGTLNCPITLSYHAGGIKVEEVASWVGLGWSLRSGGVITRSVRGLPDESGSFFFPGNNLTAYLTGGQPGFDVFLRGIENQTEDGESDMYNFSVDDLNGSFFYDQSGNIHTLPINKTRIEKTDAGWLLTATNGDKYFFDDKEYAVTSRICDAGSSTASPAIFGTSPTAWYLTKIISASEADSLIFEYDNFISNHDMALAETRHQLIQSGGSLCQPFSSNCMSVIKTYGKRLRRIVAANSIINFLANTDRADLVGDKRLDAIEIRNKENALLKKYQLYYKYAAGTNSSCWPSTYPSLERLQLDSVAQVSPAESHPPYKFYYESMMLPCRNSFARDHWGYYNGALSNTTAVPPFIYTVSGQSYTYQGGNRESNPIYAKAGTLNKIVYPTGGATLFEFESNTIWESYYIENPVSRFISIAVFPDPPQETYNETFTINVPPSSLNDNLGGVKANVSVNKTLGDSRVANVFLAELDANGNRLNVINLQEGFTPDFRIPNGTYRLTAEMPLPLSTNIADYDYFGVNFTWQEPGTPSQISHNKPIGGLRVKKMEDIHSDGAVARTRIFNYNFPNNESSGGTLTMPLYTHTITRERYEEAPPPLTGGVIYNCVYKVRQAYTNLPLTQTAGGYVGYRYVTVTEPGNGHSIFEFTNPTTNPDELYPNFPYAPSTSFEWQRGLLIRQRDFKEGSLTPERSIRNVHNTITPLSQSFSGIAVGSSFTSDIPGNLVPDYTVYSIMKEFQYLNITYDTTFSQGNPNNYLATIKTSEYNPKTLLPQKDHTYNSKNEAVINEYRYPLDYADTAMQGIIGVLKTKNILSPLVFTSKTQNGVITDGMINMFNTDGNTIKTYKFESTGLVISPPADSNIINPLPASFALNSEQLYNNKRLATTLNTGNHPISYLWDYNNTLPIAKVVNADGGQIAYTSFESNGTGNWLLNTANVIQGAQNAVPTGQKYYNLTGSATINKNGMTLGKVYIVSYWSNTQAPYSLSGASALPGGNISGRSFNGWTYYEHRFEATSGTLTISGNGGIDELRLAPENASISTATYEPTLGITSECSASNQIIYYEYDSLGRLRLLRDQDGKIVKQFEYRYHNMGQ